MSAARRASAQRVLETTEFQRLPDLRLLAFFDDADAQCFKQAYGPENRGVFLPIDTGTPWHRSDLVRDKWPQYLVDLLFTSDIDPSLISHDYDASSFHGIVYLHGSTCVNPIALVMTFAHELQHFCQFGRTPNLWVDNDRLKCHRILKPYKIPAERDARVVAKRVAEGLCGVDVVREYIRQRISNAQRRKDIDGVRDWRWIEKRDSAESYCLQSETKMAIRKMKSGER
ncbi:MAG: hypothetical protein WAL45_05470 [Terracidiphilus sp.]